MKRRLIAVNVPLARRPRVSIRQREARLRERLVESLRWLDCHAPGRAHAVLLEALQENMRERAN